MNRIAELIAHLCPDGVEYKPLGHFSRYSETRISADELDATTFVGVDNLLANKAGKTDANYTPNTARLTAYEAGDILLGNIRPYLKKVWLADNSGGCSGDVLAIRLTKKYRSHFLPEFLYYLLSSDDFFAYNMQHAKGAKMPRGNKLAILKYPIPVPPLEVQREIVQVLDAFTALEAELEAELEARRRQYGYYRDRLLAFNGRDDIRWATLGEVGELVRGNGMPKSDFVESGVGCIHYGQIYTYYGTWTTETISFVSTEKAHKLAKVNTGDIVITNTSENVEDVCKAVAWLGNTQIVTGGHATVLKHNQNPKYLAYYLQTPHFSIEKRKYATGTKVIDVSANNLAKIRIPIPPLEEQARIVAILDKFDALVNDLTSGLPAEINGRRQQYEHYRNRLLTFPEAKR